MKQATGQAYNKAQTYVYTWWDDGSVTRCFHQTLEGGSVVMGWEEVVTPPSHGMSAIF